MLFGHLPRMDESAGEFLHQYPRVIGKGWQDVLTSWLATMKNDLSYHKLSMEMPLSWHWTGHSGGYWQQAELCTELMQAEQ